MGNLTSHRHERHDEFIVVNPPINHPHSIIVNPNNPNNPIQSTQNCQERGSRPSYNRDWFGTATNNLNRLSDSESNNSQYNCIGPQNTTIHNNPYNWNCGERRESLIPILELPGFSFEYNHLCTFITDTYCCICYTDYVDGLIMQMLPCDHVLHKDCLNDWYKKATTCPICRYDTSDNIT